MDDLANWLKIKRKHMGLSQIALAKKAGIALTVVRKIEQGHTNIQLSKLFEVLQLFGYTLKIEKEIKSIE